MEMPWKPETPFVLAQPLHGILVDVLIRVPKFSVIIPLNTQEHIQKIYDALALMDITTPKVIIRLFVKTFEEEATRWYCLLPNGGIPDWDTMVQEFKNASKEQMMWLTYSRTSQQSPIMRESQFVISIDTLPSP